MITERDLLRVIAAGLRPELKVRDRMIAARPHRRRPRRAARGDGDHGRRALPPPAGRRPRPRDRHGVDARPDGLDVVAAASRHGRPRGRRSTPPSSWRRSTACAPAPARAPTQAYPSSSMRSSSNPKRCASSCATVICTSRRSSSGSSAEVLDERKAEERDHRRQLPHGIIAERRAIEERIAVALAGRRELVDLHADPREVRREPAGQRVERVTHELLEVGGRLVGHE